MEPVVWLFVFFTWKSGHGASNQIAVEMEKVPQESMAQCEANGAALKGVYSEVRWKCIKGLITSGGA